MNNSKNITCIIVDDEYMETLDLKLVEGRFFSKDFPTDSLTVVMNEKAVAELGIQDPIGKRVVTPEGFLTQIYGCKTDVWSFGIVCFSLQVD